jgi:hypothetical protein
METMIASANGGTVEKEDTSLDSDMLNLFLRAVMAKKAKEKYSSSSSSKEGTKSSGSSAEEAQLSIASSQTHTSSMCC